MNENYVSHPDYDQLPEAIKAYISPKQFAWMGDDERKRLIQDMTLPEVAEDD